MKPIPLQTNRMSKAKRPKRRTDLKRQTEQTEQPKQEEVVVREESGGIPFGDSMLLLERSSGNVGVQLMLGVRKNEPQKTRCRSLVNFDGRWVGRAEGAAGSGSSYWLCDLTCYIRPVLKT